MDVVSQHSR